MEAPHKRRGPGLLRLVNACSEFQFNLNSLSRSCVPIDTRVLWRARLACSLSCNAMKESYRSWVKVMFRSITPEHNGRICAVWACQHIHVYMNCRKHKGERTSSLMFSTCSPPSFGTVVVHLGSFCCSKNTLRFRAIPSKQSIS